MTEWKRQLIRKELGAMKAKFREGHYEITLVSKVFVLPEHFEEPKLLLEEIARSCVMEVRRKEEIIEQILSAQSRADYLAKRSVADAARRNGE